MRTLVIIPAYNESENLEKVFDDLQQHASKVDFIVINDASSDNTGDICEKRLAKVIHCPANLGIGGAVQTGLLYAKQKDYDFAIQFDGDGQHQAQEIPKLIQKAIVSQSNIVIGSRFLNNDPNFKSTWTRRIGIKFFSRFLHVILKIRSTDPTSGFRIFNRDTLHYLSENYPQDYPEPEILAIASRKGYKIQEIPVQMNAREGGKSSITPIRSIFYMYKVTLAIIMTLWREKK